MKKNPTTFPSWVELKNKSSIKCKNFSSPTPVSHHYYSYPTLSCLYVVKRCPLSTALSELCNKTSTLPVFYFYFILPRRMYSVNAVHARQSDLGPRYPSAPGPHLVPQEIWNISQMTQDDPGVTQDDPRVTQDIWDMFHISCGTR